MTWTPTISNCDKYLDERTGKYEWRRVRYMATLNAMRNNGDLEDSDTVLDLGAGWTELDYCLRVDGKWRGRYIPVDGGIDGTNLNDYYTPPRIVEWIVALEILEHLYDWSSLVEDIKPWVTKGIIISTPNPRTTNVFEMDHTHVSAINIDELQSLGFKVKEKSFYGKEADSLFGLWTA